MFDNLRDDSSFYEDDQNDLYQEPVAQAQAVPVAATKQRKRTTNTRYMGMTPQQRFLLAFMLMITVCVMGVVAMLVTGKMGLF
jgi:hypothetical protein